VIRIRSVRRKLTEIASERRIAAGDFELVTLPEADCDVLRDLLVTEHVESVIEIGLAYGSSALAIGEALISGGRNDPTHLILDPFQHSFENVGRHSIASAGLADICRLVTERSQLALPRLVSEGFAADTAFVDGSHIFHNVFVDLYFLRELIRPGGLIILDDYQWPSVATAVRYFELNAGWLSQQIDQPTRLRAFRLPTTPLEPDFKNFQPFLVDQEY
jgi:predicted O-methyltransferase YrrM